jgi:hypothetical protein
MMEKLIDKINERMNPEEVVDALGLSTEELTNLLYDVILGAQDKFYFLEEDDEAIEE